MIYNITDQRFSKYLQKVRLVVRQEQHRTEDMYLSDETKGESG